MGKIDRIFVLALENRSFDHLLGFSGIPGINGLIGPNATWSNPDGKGGRAAMQQGAPYAITDKGPGHEYLDVAEQMYGGDHSYPTVANQGFVTSYQKVGAADPSSIMRGFAPGQLPVTTFLANQFALCDAYFSALPGPTWPNRFFFHAASSGGLMDSPTAGRLAEADTLYGFKFKNGTLFELLDKKLGAGANSWAVYEGDEFPVVWGLYGMGEFPDRFSHVDQLKDDLQDPQFEPKYIFIEPSYGHVLTDYKGGSSQHPLDDVTSGERLIKQVYEAIRNSPLWESSLLVVTYDEHGGFPDHVIPPECVPPGDTGIDQNDHHFHFDQLGIRVPAIIVSPYIPAHTIEHTVYDHSSVPATVEEVFLGGAHLTARDAAAQTFTHLLTLGAPRTGGDAPPVLPEPANSQIPPPPAELAPTDTSGPLDPAQAGFIHLAMLRHAAIEPGQASATRARATAIRNKGQAHRYLEEIRSKVKAARKARRKK